MNIKEIKSGLSMQRLLDYYGITNLRQSGSNLHGCCPIHNGDNNNAFHVNLENNLWNCFTGQHGGDVLAFIMEKEGVDFNEAITIADSILSSSSSVPLPTTIRSSEPKQESNVINPPLNFQLDLDHEHSYLKKRGLTPETIHHFGLGLCQQGILHGRIAIPIHDAEGNLVAYAGRSINGDEPKYNFPRGLSKSKVLFNLHRVKAGASNEIIIVEGFFDCMTVHQAGFRNVVALMGSSLSHFQRDLVLNLDRRLIVLLDGDEAGRKGTKQIIEAFLGEAEMTIHYLSMGVQPDSMDETELKSLLRSDRNDLLSTNENICPECNASILNHQEGCITCNECGFSTCA